MTDASEKPEDTSTPEPGVRPSINVLSMPADVYPPPKAGQMPPAPRPTSRPRIAPDALATARASSGDVSAPTPPPTPPPAPRPEPAIHLGSEHLGSRPPPTEAGTGHAQEKPKAPAPAFVGPPSEGFGGILDFVTVPALAELGFKPDESARLLGGLKNALDVWNEGKPVTEALPVPEGLHKFSKMAEQFAPIVQDVVMPRLPYIIAGIQQYLKPPPTPPPPAPPAQEPPAAPPSPVEKARLGSRALKDELKKRAGQVVSDGSKIIAFPEESKEPDFAALGTPRDAGYQGPRSPNALTGFDRPREAKIQFYGSKEPVPGSPTPPPRPRSASVADVGPDAIRNMPIQDKSYTPANAPEGTWADERKDSIQPTPEEVYAGAPDPANAAVEVTTVPSTGEMAAQRAAENARMTPQPSEAAVPLISGTRLTDEERTLILGAVAKQDPMLIESLVAMSFDAASFALARKDKMTADQRTRIKSLSFADLLAEGEDFAAHDVEFAKRWSVLMKPKARVWLKQNFVRIQAGL